MFQIWTPEIEVENVVEMTAASGLSGGDNFVMMNGCNGMNSFKASYKLKTSCPLDFRYYPFDRQVSSSSFNSSYRTKNLHAFTFVEECSVAFEMESDDNEKKENPILEWKTTPRLLSSRGKSAMLNDWQRKAFFCTNCTGNNYLLLKFILKVRLLTQIDNRIINNTLCHDHGKYLCYTFSTLHQEMLFKSWGHRQDQS